MVDWLATAAVSPPNSLPAVSQQLIADIGDLVANDVTDAVLEAINATNNSKKRVALAGSHFFCDLLAALACAMEKFSEEFDQAVDYIVTRVLSSQAGNEQSPIQEFAVKVAAQIVVKGVRKLIDHATIGRQFKDALCAVQMLAVMTCPAPERHEAVARCCLRPLGEPVISAEIQERLTVSMPDWMR
ncbi:MAG: hypothetical protein ACR2MP_28805 [Streptosporangiaceae bacterium]